MDWKRALRHLVAVPAAVRRAFPPRVLAAIETAISQSERRHRAELRFAAEAALSPAELWIGKSARERGIEAFGELGVWDTEENNGVLIYLLLADHDVEIVADRGLNGRVRHDEWEAICRLMEKAFKSGRFEQGVLEGIAEVTRLLERHYPATPGGRNELSDHPVIL